MKNEEANIECELGALERQLEQDVNDDKVVLLEQIRLEKKSNYWRV